MPFDVSAKMQNHQYSLIGEKDVDSSNDDTGNENVYQSNKSWLQRPISLLAVLVLFSLYSVLWMSFLLFFFVWQKPAIPILPIDTNLRDPDGNSYPAASAIKYEIVTFGENKSYMSKEGLPSTETDQLWKDLQAPMDGIVQGSRQIGFETDRLPQTNTSRFDSDLHVYGLEVHHQLHCLDRLRKTYHAEHYFPNETQEHIIHHREHCLDHLRQAIICSGDVSLDYWRYDPEADKNWLRTDVPHVCRNFDSLSKWASEYQWVYRDWHGFVSKQSQIDQETSVNDS